MAAAFAVALLLAPLFALIRYWSDWFPSGDPALMAFRALDVGTSRTPLIGQPSLSGDYVDDQLVHHLGAIHFYMLAPFVRLLGVNLGMIVTSVLITGSCLLIAAWAVFRQFGPKLAMGAAVLLGAVSFTTGASQLVNPVSSNIAGLPYLCSIVLLMCLLMGDLRLLPLTVGMVTFTAMQHLSVLPSLAVATALAVIGGVLLLTVGTPRVDRPARRDLLLWGGGAVAVAVVLWIPLLFQNLFGNRPNLTALLDFTRDSDRPKLGYSTALRHVAHVLGLPPLLGQTEIAGDWLFGKPAFGTWVTAALVLVVLGFAAWHWRGTKPRQALLAVMALIVAFAGLVGSAAVPKGDEQTRLVFYHWVYPLALLVALVVGLLVAEGLGRLSFSRLPWLGRALVGAALLAIVVPAAVNPSLDRWTNSLQAAYSPFDRDTLQDFADQIYDERDRFPGDVVMIARKPAFDAGLDSALLLQLEEIGLSINHARYQGVFVDGERRTDKERVDWGLVLVLDTDVPFWGRPKLPPGKLIAEQELPDGITMFAHFDRDLSHPEPATLKAYLLDREELLDYVKNRELAP